jgi:subtilisin family serine protease
MHRQRPLMVGLVVVMACLTWLGPAASLTATATPIVVEHGLLAPAQPEGATPASGSADRLDLVVHLAGPSLAEVYRADRIRARADGTEPMATSTLDALRQAMVVRQQAVSSAAAGLGVMVIGAYQGAANGLQVVATHQQIPDLLRLPGVVAIGRAPVMTISRSQAAVSGALPSGPVSQQAVYDGTGTIVAVVDSGIDYTHAAFGGPGVMEAYIVNDPTVVEPGSFPTAKVVGGYDFVGERYTSSCPVGSPPTWCTDQPEPDDDPLDGPGGHGTHVASVAAGMAGPGLPAGAAPAAQLVALKVFGSPIQGIPQTTTFSGLAIDWAVKHNLGVQVEGTAPPGKINVLNLSVDSPWSVGMVETNRLVAAAVDAGITVIASAGNAGNKPYIVGSPGAAEMALAVSGSQSPGQSAIALQATWQEGGQPKSLQPEPIAIEGSGTWLPPLASTGTKRSLLGWYGLACNDSQGNPTPPAQDVTGKIALIERGTCSFYDKVWNAQKRGAIAAVIFTDGRMTATMGCVPSDSDCADPPAIPGVMIDRVPGLELKDLVFDQGIPVTVTLDPNHRIDLTNAIMPTASRGPSRSNAGIKPQIAAPGVDIVGADASTGNQTIAYSGTSVAAPQIAGLAARLWQRNNQQHLQLLAGEIGALAVNYATPVIKEENPATGDLAPVARQGAGLVASAGSAGGGTVVRSPTGIAELNFGNQHVLDDPGTVEQQLTVKSLTNADKTLRVTAQLTYPDDAGHGVDLAFDPILTVPALSARALPIRLNLDPSKLRPWSLGDARTLADEPRFRNQEVGGWLQLTEVDSSMQPVAGGDQIEIPFYVLPRRQSCTASQTASEFVLSHPGGTTRQSWHNPCGLDGQVEVYHLVGVDPAESSQIDGFDPALDVRSIGLRWGPENPADPASTLMLEWAINTVGSRRIPWDVEFHLYVDVNNDGQFEQAVFNQPEVVSGEYTGRWFVGHAPVEPSALDNLYINFDKAELTNLMRFDIDESTSVLAIPAQAIGLDLNQGQGTIRVGLIALSNNEDLPITATYPGYDVVPDALTQTGEALAFDQALARCVALTNAQGKPVGQYGDRLAVPGKGESAIDIGLASTCRVPTPARNTDLLFSYPSNMADSGSSTEIRRGRIGAVAIFLPLAAKLTTIP